MSEDAGLWAVSMVVFYDRSGIASRLVDICIKPYDRGDRIALFDSHDLFPTVGGIRPWDGRWSYYPGSPEYGVEFD